MDDGDEAEEIATPTRQFTLFETTSGLPDDSLEADEREESRRLRDLRGRVKAARAVIATTPGLAEALRVDWRKAARFGITETMFRGGDPGPEEDVAPSENAVYPWDKAPNPILIYGCGASSYENHNNRG